jgi:phospholipase/lecithinase/hemolysin
MKQRILFTALALLTLLIVLFIHPMKNSSVIHTPTIQGLYVFGDSLSDTGTVFRATGGTYPPNPPYFQGRYSNGRVWVEYLADRLHLSPNQANSFAWGGATTGNVPTQSGQPADVNSFVPNVLMQVQSLVQTNTPANPDALYVLWAGANDYLQGMANTNAPVENLTKAIASLAKIGAKKILVANLPDLGQLPVTRTTAISTQLSRLSQSHNQGLRRSLKLLNQQYPDLQLAVLDAYSLYRAAIDQPAKFGYSNVVAACLVSTHPCGNPDQFLFWDGLHPTTATHRHLADAALAAIQQTGIISSKQAVLP